MPVRLQWSVCLFFFVLKSHLKTLFVHVEYFQLQVDLHLSIPCTEWWWCSWVIGWSSGPCPSAPPPPRMQWQINIMSTCQPQISPLLYKGNFLFPFYLVDIKVAAESPFIPSVRFQFCSGILYLNLSLGDNVAADRDLGTSSGWTWRTCVWTPTVDWLSHNGEKTATSLVRLIITSSIISLIFKGLNFWWQG